MTPAEYRALQSEVSFQKQVIHLAKLKGWRVHAERPARTKESWATPIQGDPGWPDLVMVRGQRIIIAELKSATGRLRPEQQEWIVALQRAQHPIDSLGHEEPGVYVFLPTDWDRIMEVLQ